MVGVDQAPASLPADVNGGVVAAGGAGRLPLPEPLLVRGEAHRGAGDGRDGAGGTQQGQHNVGTAGELQVR